MNPINKNLGNIVTQIDNTYPWGQRISFFPKMLKATFQKTWRGASRTKILLAFAGFLYVLSPIDFIPELILGPFGLADDMVILALGALYLTKKTDQYISDSTPPKTVQGTIIEIDNI
jgi:uncharacterized membrane protein YkvA (DUF1232 family)